MAQAWAPWLLDERRDLGLKRGVFPEFLDPEVLVRKTQSRLPHWQQDGRTYFVTFRLVDSLPHFLVRDYETERTRWLAVHPEPWSIAVQREYHTRFSVRMDRWLDEGHGECLLKNPEAAEVVAEAFRRDDGCRYLLHAWVIMPNHAHVVFSLLGEWTLEAVMQGWKGASARRVNQLFGRDGPFWMKGYFDRMVRDSEHFEKVLGYVRRNPEKARLREGEFLIWEREGATGDGG